MRYVKKKYRGKRKRTYRKPKLSLKSVNQKIKKIQTAIERKHLDTFYSNTVGLSGTVFAITGALQGVSDTQRIGDKITTTSIMIKYMLSQHDAPYNTFRVVCVRARSGATVPAVGNVFLNGSGPQSTMPSLWHYNLDWFRSGKAKILYDKCFTLQGPNTDEPGTITRSVKIPFRTNIQYQGGTISANNQIYMMVITDSGTVPHPPVSVNVRINYIDL